MSGDGDGNLSDSSCSAVSGLSLRDGGNQRQLVNPNLNLSISSTSGDAHDPKTREILRLRAENADLKRRLQDIDDSSDDDDGQGNDANKSWSELGKRRKKQLLSNRAARLFSTPMTQPVQLSLQHRLCLRSMQSCSSGRGHFM